MDTRLTHRDVAVLRLIASNILIAVDDIAARCFGHDWRSDPPNPRPLATCVRKLRDLAARGLVCLDTVLTAGRQQRVARLTPAALQVLDGAKRGRVPARNRSHHLQTLRAIEHLSERARAQGGRVGGVLLEGHLRSKKQRGRKTQRGDAYPAFPDAVCTLHRRGKDLSVAVEYVTSKYTDADILRKSDAFSEYDRAVWFSDTAKTAQRVERLTGKACKVLS